MVTRVQGWLGDPVRRLRLAFAAVALFWLGYLARTGWTRSGSPLEIPPMPWPKTAELTHVAWYWAAWASLALALAGLALAPWLLRRPGSAPGGGEGTAAGPRQLSTALRRSHAAVMAGSLLLFLAIAWPRMSFGLWGDENMNFRLMAVGQFIHKDESTPPRFVRRSFYDACFSYPDTNDHQLYSILGHLSHNGLGGINRKDQTRPWMTEWKYRLPALLAGLLGIALSGQLFRKLGRPWAALLLMPLLALHPWYLRYATEARGYSLLFALVPLGLLLLVAALERGRRRDWAGFGLVLALQLMANLNQVGMIGLTGLAALGAVLWQGRQRRGAQFSGLLLAGMVALLFWLPFFTPCLPGLRKYMEENQNHQGAKVMNGEWFGHEVSLFTEGVNSTDWDRENPYSVGADELPLPLPLLGSALAVAFGGGVVWLARRRGLRWLLLPMGGTAPLMIGLYAAEHFYLFPWYVVNAMPLMLGLAAVGAVAGLEGLARLLRAPGPALRWVTPAGVALLVAAYAWQTRAPRTALRDHSLEQIREAVRLTRHRINPFLAPDPDVITVGIWFFNKTYDPFRIDVENPQQLQELIERTRREHKRLFVDLGQLDLARQNRGELMRLVEDPRQFHPIATLWSTQGHENTRVIYQLNDPILEEGTPAAAGDGVPPGA